MITLINKTDIYEYYGLSTDTKPSNIPNGSLFKEIDTGDEYRYSISDDTWYKQG